MKLRLTKKKVAAIAVATGLVMGGVVLLAVPSYADTLALDKVVTTAQTDGGRTITSPPLSTGSGGELLLAFLATDGAEVDTQSFASVVGGGLTWHPVTQAHEQAGAAEIWGAWAPAALSNVTVTATRALGSWHGLLTVAAFTGADPAGPVGAVAQASGANGAPTLTATTQRAGSWVWGVGNDWDRAAPRFLARGQRMVAQSVDTGIGDTYWAQRTRSAVSRPGTAVHFGTRAPASDRWNLAAVEIVPARAAGAPAQQPPQSQPPIAAGSPSAAPSSAAPKPPASPSPTQTVAGPPPPSTGEFTPAYYAKWSNSLPSDVNFFPLAVWDQSPTRTRNGAINAVNYKNLGINTFAGLWDFPGASGAAGDLAAIRNNGMYALAGENPVTGSTGQALGSTKGLAGYQLGDEQDMSTNPSHTTPAQVTAAANALRAADSSRPIYNNWGKAFSVYPWVGAHDNDAGLRQYCSQTDINSSDYYAATDGWEPSNKHTPNFYGQAVDHVRALCGASKPAYGFIETGHPDGSTSANWAPYSSNGTITAATIEEGVWSELAHGANGIVYFVHDFRSNGFTEDGVFDHPDAVAMVKKINATILSMASILNAQRQPTGLTTSGADATLRADAAGRYVIAAGNTASTHTATFTLAAAAGKQVQVVGENRTLTADANGTWTDSFAGWGHHVYKIV